MVHPVGSSDRAKSEASHERALDELFGTPLEGFVAARDALAVAIKAAGDAPGAKEIKAIKRPSVSAWAVNALYRVARTDFDELLAAGVELRAAAASSMRGAGGAELRAAQTRQASVMTRLRARAVELLTEAGHGATPSTVERVARTLLAISSRGTFAPYAPGRLLGDIDPPGFDELASIVALAPAGTRPTPLAKHPAVSAPHPSTKPREDAKARKRELARAEQKAADTAAKEARAIAEEAATEAERARKATAVAEERVTRALEGRSLARERQRDAEAHEQRAEAAAKKADRRAMEARAEIEDAGLTTMPFGSGECPCCASVRDTRAGRWARGTRCRYPIRGPQIPRPDPRPRIPHPARSPCTRPGAPTKVYPNGIELSALPESAPLSPSQSP